MVLSYLEQILSYPERETLIATCPALALFIFQELVASLRNGKRIPDPASVHDEVSVFLSIDSMPELTERVFAPHATDAVTPLFWMTLRKALSCAWDPNPEGDTQQMLCEVNGVVRFLRTDVPCVPLAGVSLQNALSRSRNMLRMVTACALAGSLEPLGTNSEQPISVMLQFSNLIPPPPEVGVVTPEGLNFCMQPIQQQWWTLVSVALDRVLAVAATQGVLRAELWQLLAVLFALDTSEFVYPFPDREKDFAAFQLLARLSEVGLVYHFSATDNDASYCLHNSTMLFAGTPRRHCARLPYLMMIRAVRIGFGVRTRIPSSQRQIFGCTLTPETNICWLFWSSLP
ncbi:hypothetical protein ERJ75_000966900 [Trypanosoma vivax]|nr:hypothetical protein ERJ75_000966900 [Trypanosoma vivax]